MLVELGEFIRLSPFSFESRGPYFLPGEYENALKSLDILDIYILPGVNKKQIRFSTKRIFEKHGASSNSEAQYWH